MFQTAYDMEMETMCTYPSSNYASPNWKCVLHCCVQCPRIGLLIPESDQQNSNVCLDIIFHVYQHIAYCTVHVRNLFNENTQCQFCESSVDTIVTIKLYTRKDIFMM